MQSAKILTAMRKLDGHPFAYARPLAALIIESDLSNPLSDDEDLRLLIDQQLDDGDLHTGLIQVGSTNSLVFIIEPSEGVVPLPPPAMSALPQRKLNLRIARADHARLPRGLIFSS